MGFIIQRQVMVERHEGKEEKLTEMAIGALI